MLKTEVNTVGARAPAVDVGACDPGVIPFRVEQNRWSSTQRRLRRKHHTWENARVIPVIDYVERKEHADSGALHIPEIDR